jgi:hypothetical protein
MDKNLKAAFKWIIELILTFIGVALLGRASELIMGNFSLLGIVGILAIIVAPVMAVYFLLSWKRKPILNINKETVKKEIPVTISNNNFDEQLQTGKNVIKKSVLLPDNNEIDKLNVTNSFLDNIYEKARIDATKINDDAKLSSFSIGVFPFDLSSKVCIYMIFYSKWANRKYEFRYSENSQKVEHLLPDERSISSFERRVFAKVPWRKNTHWMQFLDRAYAKVKSLPVSEDAHYTLEANAHSKMPWAVIFNDGFGNPHIYRWNGVGLNEKSIIET